MIRTDRRMRLCVAWLLCNLCFIWGNSLLPGEVSQAISDWLKQLLSFSASGGSGKPGGSGLLRKIAHFAEFASLGMCLTWLLAMRGKHKAKALLWGILAACVDETIQVFVPNRGPGLKDVALDTCGVIAGMGVLLLGHSLIRKICLWRNKKQ